MLKTKTWNCECSTCRQLDKLKARRRNVLLSIAAVIVMVVVVVIAANAQTPAPGVPACFYTPEIILKVNPAREPVTVATRTFGAPRTVDAVSYLRAIQGDVQPTTAYERAAVAAQYTIQVNGPTLKGMRLAAFVDNVPDITVGQAIHSYTWSPNTATRLNIGYWLYQAVSNNPCISEAIWPR